MNISNNYIMIQGWMVQELNLKGNDLLCFALIYGFCQDKQSRFTGSLKYIETWLNISRPTAIKSLKNLEKKDLIVKFQNNINGVTFNQYSIKFNSLGVVKKLYRGSKETLHGGSKETLPYNTINNNTNNIIGTHSQNDLINSINSNSNNLIQNQKIGIKGLFKQNYLEIYPTYIFTDSDDKSLGAIQGFISKQITVNKKFNDGIVGHRATKAEKVEMFKQIINNLPKWVQEKSFDISYISYHINKIYKEVYGNPKIKNTNRYAKLNLLLLEYNPNDWIKLKELANQKGKKKIIEQQRTGRTKKDIYESLINLVSPTSPTFNEKARRQYFYVSETYLKSIS